MKERLDVLLVKRNLAESREKAKAVIMSGIVYVDGQKEDKAGSMFDETANVEVRGTTLKYVSRGGLKLEKAMTHFGVTLEGKICMDVGASTGGFTDCMLQNGAVKVYSVDVGHGQLAWKLRNDERVVCMEKTNIRYVTPEEIPDRIQFVSIDVSFISLTKVLGPVKALMEPDGEVVCSLRQGVRRSERRALSAKNPSILRSLRWSPPLRAASVLRPSIWNSPRSRGRREISNICSI